VTYDGRRMTDDVGLCRTCRWVQVVTNRRGSTFFRCRLADTDARFVRYPPLPVLLCAGYEKARREPGAEAEPELGGPAPG